MLHLSPIGGISIIRLLSHLRGLGQTCCLSVFSKKKREETGDQLGFGLSGHRKGGCPEGVFPAFSSLFQGDHLGVEFALCAHQTVLEDECLLVPGEQILSRHVFPKGPRYSGLVIDDYFFISREPFHAEKIHTAARHLSEHGVCTRRSS